MNKVFQEHHYYEHITRNDIFHVGGCKEVWAADLDSETRVLVQQVYKRDFELLCKHFNYCDVNENTCISQVPEMCPKHMLGIMSQKNGPVLENDNIMHLI